MGKVYHYSRVEFKVGDSLKPNKDINFNNTRKVLESNLEEIRTSRYPNFPSRLNCLYVAPTEELAKEWAKRINIDRWRNYGENVDFFVYEVDVEKNLYWFNNDVIMMSVYDNIVKREDYWESAIEDISEIKEGALYETMLTESVIISRRKKYRIDASGNIAELEDNINQ